MNAIALIFLGLSVLAFSFLTAISFIERNFWATLFYCGIAVFCLVFIVVITSCIFQDGSPVTQIPPGVYKVGFVYPAGENVSIGIEKSNREKKENLYLYQFPKSDFLGEIKIENAKKLTVYRVVDQVGIARYFYVLN